MDIMLSVVLLIAAVPLDQPQAAPVPVAPPTETASTSAPAPATDTPQPDDVIVTARPHVPGDPFVALNAKSYELTQKVDQAVVAPIAFGFAAVVPAPARDGLGNALKNLREPDIFLNFLLQHRIGKAAETAGRFVINSTLGVAGLFDVAKRKPFRLPRRPNGFGDTFGFYGVKPGPFFFLPIVGPVTLRDLVGGGLDRLVLPLAVGRPFSQLIFTVATGVASTLDRRAAFDDQLQKFRAQSDPYSARRDFYLNMRRAEIENLHRGRHDDGRMIGNP